MALDIFFYKSDSYNILRTFYFFILVFFFLHHIIWIIKPNQMRRDSKNPSKEIKRA